MAAALVAISHTVEHGLGSVPQFFGISAAFGVTVFFVISGFVISYVVSDGAFDPISFLKRRLWRVVPLYWALTLLVAALAIVAPSIFKTTTFGASYLLKSLLFIPAALPGTTDYRPLLKPGWTLNFEMIFYACFALLFWVRSVPVRNTILTLLFAGIAALQLFASPLPGEIAFYAKLDLLAFVAGMWLALAWKKDLIEHLGSAARIALLGLAIASTIILYLNPQIHIPLVGPFLPVASATFIVLAALAWDGQFSFGRVAVWMGNISYSLYLAHMFVIGAAWAVLHKLHIGMGSRFSWVAVIAIFATTLLAADMSFRFFEQPLLRWEKSRRRRTDPLTSVPTAS